MASFAVLTSWTHVYYFFSNLLVWIASKCLALVEKVCLVFLTDILWLDWILPQLGGYVFNDPSRRTTWGATSNSPTRPPSAPRVYGTRIGDNNKSQEENLSEDSYTAEDLLYELPEDPSHNMPDWLTGKSSSDDGGVGILILAFVLIVAVFGTAIYFVWMSPTILADSLFQFCMSAGLIRRFRLSDSAGWGKSLLRHTAYPVALVLLASCLFGQYIDRKCPEVRTFYQAVRQCGKRQPAGNFNR